MDESLINANIAAARFCVTIEKTKSAERQKKNSVGSVWMVARANEHTEHTYQIPNILLRTRAHRNDQIELSLIISMLRQHCAEHLWKALSDLPMERRCMWENDINLILYQLPHHRCQCPLCFLESFHAQPKSWVTHAWFGWNWILSIKNNCTLFGCLTFPHNSLIIIIIIFLFHFHLGAAFRFIYSS